MKALDWWKLNGAQYPRLFNLVKYTLCVMSTSVPSEQAFSMASEHITKRRNRLSDLSNQAAMCLKSYISRKRAIEVIAISK